MAGKTIDQLYNDKSRIEGAGAFNTIHVFDANVHKYPNDPEKAKLTGGQKQGFYGILQNNFSYNVQADWEAKLANIDVGGGIGKAAIKAATGDISRSGIFTEKFYQGASYLVINPVFRVVDWNGTGVVMETAIIVANKLLPVGNKKILSEAFSDLDALGKTVGEKTKSAAGAVIDSTVETLIDIPTAYSNAVTKVFNSAAGLVNKLKWGEPEPVRVKIGNFFDMNNMILESCSIEFSKEMTKNGPLYADFTVQFSTKLALVKNNTGLIARDGNGAQLRVKGNFAEDRAFAKSESARAREYAEDIRYTRVEESWLLAKLRDDYGIDPVNAILN